MKWTILILVILGLVAAFATTVLVSVLRTDKQAGDLKGDVEVVVAKRSLPAMSVITSDLIEKNKVPRKGLPDGSLTDSIQAVGRVLAVPVVEGQVLTKYSFITQGTGAQLLATLPQGMRAVSVPISGNSAVMGGMLYPGCVVDVLASFRLPGSERRGEAISTSLLQGVQVLAVQEESIVSRPSEDKKNKLLEGKKDYGGNLTVTLMVDTKQAEALQLAMDNGKISLAMRNPLDKMPVDIDATVLSQGRLAKGASQLESSVPIARQNWSPSDSNQDSNSLNAWNTERLRKVFSDTEDWTRKVPQWQVTVIRGSEVKEEMLEVQENETPVENEAPAQEGTE
jgi:pilus assembly protein CpaB